MTTGMMTSLGLPKMSLLKNWTLIGFNVYLIFSLNFVCIYGQEIPHRIGSQPRHQSRNSDSTQRSYHHNFNASPNDHSARREPNLEPSQEAHLNILPNPFLSKNVDNFLAPPPSKEQVDTLDLRQSPSSNSVAPQLVEHSIDRFDAYGEYDYIDVDQHPTHVQYHKPLRHRPGYQAQKARPRPVKPQRRVDNPGLTHHHPNHRYQPQHQQTYQQHAPAPYRRPPPPQHYFQQQPTNYIPLQALRPPRPQGLGFFNLFGLDKKDESPSQQHLDESSGGLFDPLLELVGLKKDQPVSPSDYQQYEDNQEIPSHLQFHDPLEYDYGEYVEGYPNYVKPQRPKSVPERIARWFTGFRIPSDTKPKIPVRQQNFERIQSAASSGDGGQSEVDYSQYDTGDDENLIFYNQNVLQRPLSKPTDGLYEFSDVLQAIRNNETSSSIAKKFLSAAAGLSERSDSNPVFMMWTIPTTILALLGVVYFVGAVSIIGYKHMLQGNGDAAALLPVFVIFTIPLILGFIFVTSRSAVNGELAINKVMRGDIKGSMRQDFDGVDFVMDAIFGSSALLGIGWLVSITV